jgi:hypothetical protein
LKIYHLSPKWGERFLPEWFYAKSDGCSFPALRPGELLNLLRFKVGQLVSRASDLYAATSIGGQTKLKQQLERNKRLVLQCD